MAIPKELTTFTDEADFVARFLIPLLHRLGFSLVVNYHGQREFGRDLIVGEIDRFGHVLYYGIQAKFIASISQTQSHGLIADAKEAFAHTFHHPQRQSEERICRFYVVNAGTVATNARDNFFAALEKPIAANSVLLNGKDLLALDRLAAVRSRDKELLTGLLLEVRSNRSFDFAAALQKYLETNQHPLFRYRLAAVSAMLERPILIDAEFIDCLAEYWTCADMINRIVDSVDVPFFSREGFKEPRVEKAIQLIGSLKTLADQLDSRLQMVMNELGGPLTG